MAKLPTGVGTWPAIWMLGKNINENGAYWQSQGYGTTGWPACGEIDIMEHWGHNQNYVQSAMHTPSSFGATVNHGGQYIGTASTEFHLYALDWYPDRMVFSVDGVVHYTYMPEVQNADTWPFDADQYLLLNIAIQPSILPNFTESAMEIDYVRVYQEESVGVVAPSAAYLLTVSPNPAGAAVDIKSPTEAWGGDVYIYDAQSRLIQQVLIQSEYTRVDTADWLPGTYIFQYQGHGQKQTFRVIKM
ncbi:MAG: family 16 glycosylhydrolase [Saprospiraceae bacterium]